VALTGANRSLEAVELFKQALSVDPGNSLLWTNLGLAQQKMGDYEEAMDSFQMAIGLDDESADPWYSMGIIYYHMNDFQAADRCYQTALRRNEACPQAWNNLGVLRFNQGSYEEARFCFEEALIFLPLYYDALFNLRDACEALGDVKAAAEFDRALAELKP
jgi:tetratricopeptide (TPR) repeat protein